MNKKTAAQLTKLLESSKFKTDADFRNFEKACAALAGTDDVEVLDLMLDALTDADAGEIQYELITACEASADGVFIPCLIAKAAKLSRQSPFWYRHMLVPLINSDNVWPLLRKCIEDASPETKTTLRQLVNQYSKDKLLDKTAKATVRKWLREEKKSR